VKYESLGQTTIFWVGQDKQIGHKISVSKGRAQSDSRAGQDGHFREVLQGVAAQV
jgi:hypothetical protein